MSVSTRKMASPRWHCAILIAAAGCSLFLGSFSAVFPGVVLSMLSIEPQAGYTELWRYLGIGVGVYGVGYWCASYSPVQHWPIVLVGLLSKFSAAIGFLLVARSGNLPLLPGILLLVSAVMWSIPFVSLLRFARRSHLASKVTGDFVYSSTKRPYTSKHRGSGTVVRMTVRAASDS